MITTFDELKSLSVIDASGEVLGRVVDLELEPTDWNVKALIVRLERRAADKLGMHRLIGSTDLALKIIHVHAIGDTVLLRDTIDDLARIAPDAKQEAESLRH